MRRVDQLEVMPCGHLVDRCRRHVDDRNAVIAHIVTGKLVAVRCRHDAKLGCAGARRDQFCLAVAVQHLHRRNRGRHKRLTARLIGARRIVNMDDLLGRNAHMLARLRLRHHAVVGMAGQHIIGDRALRCVHLNPHADLVAVLRALVLLVVDHLGFDELKRDAVTIAAVFDDAHECFAVTRQGDGNIPLRIAPRHAASDVAVALAAPSLERILNDGIACRVQRPIIVPRAHLQTKTVITDHVGLDEVQITLCIFVVPRQFPAAVAQDRQSVAQFAISRKAGPDEVCKQPALICACVVAAIAPERLGRFHRRVGAALEDVENAHQTNLIRMVAAPRLPRAIALRRR